MFTKRYWIVVLLLIGLCALAGYFLLSPDLLALQTRVIAATEARNSGESVRRILALTEQIEAIRADYEMVPSEHYRLFPAVSSALDRWNADEMETLLRVYARAMRLSTSDTTTYTLTYLEALRRLRVNAGDNPNAIEHLKNIKQELNLSEIESAEFDAIIAKEPFP